MPFANFQKLSASHKREKLIYAFAKIILQAEKNSWIFRCCRNMFAVRELYLDLLDMMCNIRSFAISLLEDDEIENLRGLDFLTNDLHIMLNVLLECLKNKELDTDEKLDTLFHLAHSVNDLLLVFEYKYL